MFDENFTFDRKGVTDTSSSRRDAEEPESAMSPKEVYAELPPPPPSLEAAATQQRTAASAYANSNPPAGKEATATATESDTVDSLARQLGRQTLMQEDPQYQWRRSQQPFVYEPGPFYDQRIVPRSSSGSRLGDDEPMVRLLSYRRAGAMTRVQKLGLSFRSAQHTALQCANLKPNKTRMRRRDRKPSKAQPTPTPAPSAVGASST
ncbi:hypothetical protein PG984_002354 [Apiospora sp. TS-2023a]